MHSSLKKPYLLLSFGLVIFYLISHLYHLTALPVFADEAIYIRWSQLIIDDPVRYFFFAMNDGKTPLQIWLMVPFQLLFSNQLFAGRLISVVAGLGQLAITAYTIRLLGGRKKYQLLGMLFVAVLPYWYFHHRMALIDGALAMMMSLSFMLMLMLQKSVAKHGLALQTYFLTVLTGISFGLSIWTKVPALLVVPALTATLLLYLPDTKTLLTQKNLQILGQKLLLLSSIIGIGLVVFASLRISPAFGQLFSRGSDFLFPWQEVILGGVWTQTIQNTPAYLVYFGNYFGWPLLFFVLFGLFSPVHKIRHHVLFVSALGFFVPIALMGKVVYPRYLFPTVIFLTYGATLSIQDYVDTFVSQKKTLITKTFFGLLLALLLANTLGQSAVFMASSISNPDTTPFVSSDQKQYLTEWSSGHGITETVDLINTIRRTESVAVATEGSFGTLPDGLLLYFHGQNVDNLYIEGTQQYPVKSLPTFFIDSARDYDRKLLVANSDRIEYRPNNTVMLAEFCRPYEASCLQVWDFTDVAEFSEQE